MRWVLLITIVLHTTFGGFAMDLDELKMSRSPPINLDTNLRSALLKALTDLENEDPEKSGNNEIDEIIEHASVSTLSMFSNFEISMSPTIATTATTVEVNRTKIPSILVQKSPSVQHSSITTIEKKDLDPFNDAEKILTSFTLPNRNSSSESNQRITDRSNPNFFILKKKKITPNINKVETTTVLYDMSTEENEAKVEHVQFFSAPLVAAFTVHQDAQGVPKKVEPIFKTNLRTDKKEIKLLQDNKLGKNDMKEQEILQQKIDNQSSTFRQYSQGLINNLFLNHITTFQLTTEKPVESRFHSNAIIPSSSLFGNQQLPNKPPQQFNEMIYKSKNVVSLFPSNIYHPLTDIGQLPLNGQILPVKGPINFHTPIIQTAGFHQFHSLPQLNFDQRQNNQAEFDSTGHQRTRFLWQKTITDSHMSNNLNEMPPSFSIQKSIQSSVPTDLSGKKILTDNFNMVFAPPGKRFFRSNLEANHIQPQNNRILRSNLDSLFKSNHYDWSQVNHNQFSNALINSGAFEAKSLEDINIISKVLSLDYLDGIQFENSRRSQQ